jgi:serine/threonine protein kinase
MGTITHTAPEVLIGEKCSKSSDVYSLGVILWEIETEIKPWGGLAQFQIIGAVVYENKRLEVKGGIFPTGLIASCFGERQTRPKAEDLYATLANIYNTFTENQKLLVEDNFLCSISHEIMIDPVICADGHTYDRNHIERWLENHETSPKTNLPLENKNLVPNRALRNTIEQFKSNRDL